MGKLEHRAAKKVDHLMEILKLEHAAATADAPKKSKKVDHVVEILKLEHNAARLGKKVDHVVEILKPEHAAAVRACSAEGEGENGAAQEGRPCHGDSQDG